MLVIHPIPQKRPKFWFKTIFYLKDVVTLAVSVLTVRAPAMCLPILTVRAEISVTPQDERFVKLGSENRGGGGSEPLFLFEKKVCFFLIIRNDELMFARFTKS